MPSYGSINQLFAFREIFNNSSLVHRNQKRNENILRYLDDFLFGGEANTSTCKETLDTFRDICSMWGVPLAEDKTVEPVEVLTFLGIEFDTIRMELRLPKEKHFAINHILTVFMH